MYRTHFDSLLGALTILSDSTGIHTVLFGSEAGDEEAGDPLQACAVFEAYFKGELTAIDALPLSAKGTVFQHEVWTALRKIPAGETTTYSALAKQIGRPKAVRAVGAANGANPIPIIVPCHRVIGASGRLVGYAGGLDWKRGLLAHEGAPGFIVP